MAGRESGEWRVESGGYYYVLRERGVWCLITVGRPAVGMGVGMALGSGTAKLPRGGFVGVGVSCEVGTSLVPCTLSRRWKEFLNGTGIINGNRCGIGVRSHHHSSSSLPVVAVWGFLIRSLLCLCLLRWTLFRFRGSWSPRTIVCNSVLSV